MNRWLGARSWIDDDVGSGREAYAGEALGSAGLLGGALRFDFGRREIGGDVEISCCGADIQGI